MTSAYRVGLCPEHCVQVDAELNVITFGFGGKNMQCSLWILAFVTLPSRVWSWVGLELYMCNSDWCYGVLLDASMTDHSARNDD